MCSFTCRPFCVTRVKERGNVPTRFLKWGMNALRNIVQNLFYLEEIAILYAEGDDPLLYELLRRSDNLLADQVLNKNVVIFLLPSFPPSLPLLLYLILINRYFISFFYISKSCSACYMKATLNSPVCLKQSSLRIVGSSVPYLKGRLSPKINDGCPRLCSLLI